MKISLLAYSFPPLIDAQSFRGYYLVNAPAELGTKTDVITVKYPLQDKTPLDLHKNTEVFRMDPGPIEFFALRAKSNIRVDGEGNRRLRKSVKFKRMKSSYWGLRNFIGNLLPNAEVIDHLLDNEIICRINVEDFYQYSWEKRAQRIDEHLMEIW
jgi:hypothetical protein